MPGACGSFWREEPSALQCACDRCKESGRFPRSSLLLLLLLLLQVNGGSQSFNVVSVLRNLGRYMRMFTIPNQSSIPKAWLEFDEVGVVKTTRLLPIWHIY
jgi:hypothetical protein